jgi:NADH dehydrogenase/NADH:ubiquinone oxidoreductase subunit G
VEVVQAGRADIKAACCTPAGDGMVVRTNTADARRARRLAMQLILARCPGVASLWNFAAKFGVTDTPFERTEERQDCILCGLCERVCGELLGANAIAYAGRGIERKVVSPFDKENEACLGCEACANICPTGRITSRRLGQKLVMETWKTTHQLAVCPGCGGAIVTERLIEFLKPRLVELPLPIDECPSCRRRLAARRYLEALHAGRAGHPQARFMEKVAAD